MSTLLTVVSALVGNYLRPVRNIVGRSDSGTTPVQTATPGSGSVLSGLSNNKLRTITADAVVRELHEDRSTMTEHPVEIGTTIADHAYENPAKLELEYGWSASSDQNFLFDPNYLKNMYDLFRLFKRDRLLCTVNTGKRQYTNMLVVGLSTQSDKENENILLIRAEFQEAILVGVTLSNNLVNPDPNAQALPQQTAPVVPQGEVGLTDAPNFSDE